MNAAKKSQQHNGHQASPAGSREQSVLVILAIGLILCLLRLGGWQESEYTETSKPFTPCRHVWLADGGRFTEGLYRIPDQTVSETGIPFQETELPPRIAPFLFLPIPINKADHELLMTIPGIGPRLADRIVAGRKGRGFHAPEELLSIQGIGPVKLRQISKHLAF